VSTHKHVFIIETYVHVDMTRLIRYNIPKIIKRRLIFR